MNVGEVIQAVLVGILVLVTAYYAIKTAEIAKKAAAQTEELQKQRKLSTQPWVFPDLHGGRVISGADIPLKNFGNGPAVTLRAFVVQGVTSEIVDEWTHKQGPTGSVRGEFKFAALSAGGTANWEHAFETHPKDEKGLLLVEYRDIYGDEFLSGYEYRINDVDGHLKVVSTEPIGVHHR